MSNKTVHEIVLVLHDVRSVHNVGAIFRTADAIGVRKIYLSSITPGPLDRFGRERNDFAKTALGAEKTVSWESYNEPGLLLEELRKDGYRIAALEQSSRSCHYKTYEAPHKIAILAGNEVSGIPNELLQNVDEILEIPMRGSKESLNISVALGVLLYALFDEAPLF